MSVSWGCPLDLGGLQGDAARTDTLHQIFERVLFPRCYVSLLTSVSVRSRH
jgi:hypothetical protein